MGPLGPLGPLELQDMDRFSELFPLELSAYEAGAETRARKGVDGRAGAKDTWKKMGIQRKIDENTYDVYVYIYIYIWWYVGILRCTTNFIQSDNFRTSP